ncbi:MAG: tRNA (N6-isopentenyl adenosine(37)-C2)-methylthiotransferase MiaB [Oscillospiraceae bacterium]|jgi:tRNA-2-methylthio-N6-dimethylallyladenosine synthase|nr:tRNA (N6-isopentenyl adenosine(37)-C2)-methylthiotransferase MiaB [Oscillospiraceae bacterium]
MFYIEKIKDFFKSKYNNYKAFVKVFGCRQNEADAEKIRGLLTAAGFEFTLDADCANLIVFVTCAVRHTAENRIFGHIGKLKNIKVVNPNVIIVIYGCMTEQKEIRDKIFFSYPFVDICFGAKSINVFSKLLCEKLTNKVFNAPHEKKFVKRTSKFKALVSIMTGCNNFCSYCVVPFVRGREISRFSSDIINEIKNLSKNGYKEINLIGQNVNSYQDKETNFASLIKKIDEINGEFVLQFMTSHPKDLSFDLIDTLAKSLHFGRHLHLPLQSGSNKILKLMNRKYTKEKYLEIINYARMKIPDLTITSDIIIGFPGEDQSDFEETLSVIKKAQFTSIFTFIYSSRSGTAASKIPDLLPRSEKVERLQKLKNLQNLISEKILAKMLGEIYRVLVDSYKDGFTKCRTRGNVIIKLDKDYSKFIGKFVDCKVVYVIKSVVYGKIL